MAEIAYELCTSRKYFFNMFKKWIKHHEVNKELASKYYYELEIILDFDTEEHFHITQTIPKLSMPGNFSNFDTRLIEYWGSIIPHMITTFQHYKWICIPMTIDFGQDTGIVHQTMLIINPALRFIVFYEPYGTYIKYGRDYSKCILEWAKKDAPLGFEVTTFHAKFNIAKGIQQQILEANNKKADEFKKEMDALLELLKDTPILDTILHDIATDTNPVRNTDYTVDTFVFMEYLWKKDTKLSKKALELYAKYNSKTCVSITFVEIDAMIKGEHVLHELYTQFNTENKNAILFRKLLDLSSAIGN